MPLREVKAVKTIGWSSRGGGEFDLKGLTEDEMEAVDGALNGSKWIRVVEGRLEISDVFEGHPDQIEDETMHPFWMSSLETGGVQLELFSVGDSFDPKINLRGSSFTISSLCGYNYSPEKYRSNAKRLESYGFVCMRSKRDEGSGQFWEHWHLGDLFFAKGKLKKCVDKRKNANQRIKAKIAVDFIRRNVEFGSMDISVQRLAMVIE